MMTTHAGIAVLFSVLKTTVITSLSTSILYNTKCIKLITTGVIKIFQQR